MALTAAFEASTVFLKFSLLLVPVGCILQITGISTNYWIFSEFKLDEYDKEYTLHSGLWKSCSWDLCRTYPKFSGWLITAQAFTCLGLLTAFSTTVVVTACAVTECGSRRKACHLFAALCSALTVCLIVAGVVIYARNVNFDSKILRILHPSVKIITPPTLYWSFVMCIMASVIYLFTAVLLLLNYKKRQTYII